jgi:hypothetical protein
MLLGIDGFNKNRQIGQTQVRGTSMKFNIGDRVVVQFEVDENFVGEIVKDIKGKSPKSGEFAVKFDDNTTQGVGENQIIGLAIMKKCREQLSDEDVLDYLQEDEDEDVDLEMDEDSEEESEDDDSEDEESEDEDSEEDSEGDEDFNIEPERETKMRGPRRVEEKVEKPVVVDSKTPTAEEIKKVLQFLGLELKQNVVNTVAAASVAEVEPRKPGRPRRKVAEVEEVAEVKAPRRTRRNVEVEEVKPSRRVAATEPKKKETDLSVGSRVVVGRTTRSNTPLNIGTVIKRYNTGKIDIEYDNEDLDVERIMADDPRIFGNFGSKKRFIEPMKLADIGNLLLK